MRVGTFARSGLVLSVMALMVLAMMVSCTPHSNTVSPSEPDQDRVGFWTGVWHGLIVPISFTGSLFDDKIGVYESWNNGWGYNIGFIFGLSMLFGAGGGGSAARTKKKHREEKKKWEAKFNASMQKHKTESGADEVKYPRQGSDEDLV